MNWTNETVLKFLEAYRDQPCIWDPTHYEHKNRSTVALAWLIIHETLGFNCTVSELKKKRDSLMASFRTILNKRKKFMNSEAAELFEPHWFAYEAMAQFLGPLYLNRTTDKTEAMTITESELSGEEITHFKLEDLSSDNTTDTNECNEEIKDKTASNLLSLSSRLSKRIYESEECMEETYEIPKAKRKRKSDVDEPDDCDLYAQLLARKLRKFSENHREDIMFEIDGLIIQRRKDLAN